jgi:nucleoside-triphosphatase THEP1
MSGGGGVMFKKAIRAKSRLRLALIGASGCGKTLSALRIAAGLGQRVAVLDTERGSASKYAGIEVDGARLDFDVAELESFEPRRYVEAIRAAGRDYDVLVIDSLSHAWIGHGGIIDQKDKSGSAGFDAWRKLTPQHNELVDAILACPAHVIATMRSKTEYVVEKDERGKNVPRKVGTAPVQRDGMEYEFDVVGEIDFDHVLHVTKTRCFALDDAHIRRPGADLAATLRAWLEEGVDAPPQRHSGPQRREPSPGQRPAVSVLQRARAQLEACQDTRELDAWASDHRDALAAAKPENRDRMRAILVDVVARIGGGEEWRADEVGAVVARVAAAAGLVEAATAEAAS